MYRAGSPISRLEFHYLYIKQATYVGFTTEGKSQSFKIKILLIFIIIIIIIITWPADGWSKKDLIQTWLVSFISIKPIKLGTVVAFIHQHGQGFITF